MYIVIHNKFMYSETSLRWNSKGILCVRQMTALGKYYDIHLV